MDSANLLPALSQLPARGQRHKNARPAIEDLIATEPDIVASEFAAAVSIGVWGLWDRINASDQLVESYAAQYPNLAAERALHEHWEVLQERGPEAMAGFVSGLKGKLAEVRAVELLAQNQFTNVKIADSAIQQGWDISAINPDGAEVFFQVKTGTADYGQRLAAEIGSSEGVDYLVGAELAQQIESNAPDLAARLTDIGPDYVRIENVEDGLETLSDNEGADVPDEIGDILPYAGAILLGVSLIYRALKAERRFKEVDRTTKNKLHVVQALVVISRFGINSVLAAVGGTAGSAAGTVLPGPGTLIGAVSGALVAPALAGPYLNRHLQPHMLDLGLSITGLTEEDLFYFKNKDRIVSLGESLHRTADSLNTAVS